MLGFWPTVRSGWLPVRTYLLATARVICSRAQPPELPHPTVTPGQGRRQQGQRWRRGPKLNWGCWNVQTLHSYLHVTTAGEVNICGKDPTKIDNLCMELKTHDISLCAISEHRWRGEGQIMVDDDWLFLFSGVDKEAAKAMQGVGFLLNKEMQKAWKDADQLCEYNGGRLLRIRLRIQGRYFSVISCYAPTFRCPDEEKETFYEELGKMLDAVPRKDELVILGDFNARVGLASRDPMEDAPTVHEMVGNHGLPERNDNGVRLLDSVLVELGLSFGWRVLSFNIKSTGRGFINRPDDGFRLIMCSVLGKRLDWSLMYVSCQVSCITLIIDFCGYKWQFRPKPL